MHQDRLEITRLLTIPLAGACLLGALLWPHWRDELAAQTYCPPEEAGARTAGAATAVSTLSEPIDCEESPYLCVDGISRYIARVYADLLGRWPDPTEIDALRAAYPQGLPDLQFAQEIVASPEYRDRVVQDLTQRLLGRPATPAEQDYWSPYEHREITLGLLTTPEYAMRTGGTGEAFVAGVYQDLLGREAEPDERREALRQLATHGRTAVLQAIYDSEEHHGELVDRVYLALLRMPPDPADRAAWVRELNAGQPMELLIATIIASAAYEAMPEGESQVEQGGPGHLTIGDRIEATEALGAERNQTLTQAQRDPCVGRAEAQCGGKITGCSGKCQPVYLCKTNADGKPTKTYWFCICI